MPNGLKVYTVLVDSTGNIYQVPSCSLVQVDQQGEDNLRSLISDSSLVMDQILPRLDAIDLAPVVRSAMAGKGGGVPTKPGTHLTLVDPSGKVHRIEADQPCRIVMVDIHRERELRDLLDRRRNPSATVTEALSGFESFNLARIIRKGPVK